MAQQDAVEGEAGGRIHSEVQRLQHQALHPDQVLHLRTHTRLRHCINSNVGKVACTHHEAWAVQQLGPPATQVYHLRKTPPARSWIVPA